MTSRSIDYSPRPTAADRREAVCRGGVLAEREPRRRVGGGSARRRRASLHGVLGRMPYRGTLGDVDALARASRPAACARVASSEATSSRSRCRTASKPASPSTARRCSAWSSCRSCTSTDRRRSTTSSASPARRRSSPPTASATATSSPTSPRCAPTPELERVAVVGDRTERPRRRHDRVRRPRARRCRLTPTSPDPDAPAVVGYTSGTTSDPKGVDPHAPHAQRRDRSDAAHEAIASAGDAHGCARRARDRHAGGAARPDPARPPVIHLIDVWDPDMVLDAMLDDGPVRRAAAPPTSSRPCSTPDCTELHHR